MKAAVNTRRFTWLVLFAFAAVAMAIAALWGPVFGPRSEKDSVEHLPAVEPTAEAGNAADRMFAREV